MSVQERLHQLVDELPGERLDELLRFAEFLDQRSEWDALREFGRGHLSRLYGADGPDYSEVPLKPCR